MGKMSNAYIILAEDLRKENSRHRVRTLKCILNKESVRGWSRFI
jgi:hypothetical protein